MAADHSTEDSVEPMRFRTIWVSDIHLGTRDCKAEFLLDFLRHTESEKLYLVGDIIDGWRLRKQWFWPKAQSTVIQKVLRKSRKGTEVIFIPGNHDEFLRSYVEMTFGDIRLIRDDIHTLADGRTLFVCHGDEFDSVMHYAKWLAYLGDMAYMTVLRLNHYLNYIRRRMGKPYWSLSALLKHKVKQAVQIIGDFEVYLANAARRHGADGVVCGHIHHAEMRDIDGILYCNDGDWVESCTALVEHFDGTLEILYWTEIMQQREAQVDEQLHLFS